MEREKHLDMSLYYRGIMEGPYGWAAACYVLAIFIARRAKEFYGVPVPFIVADIEGDTCKELVDVFRDVPEDDQYIGPMLDALTREGPIDHLRPEWISDIDYWRAYGSAIASIGMLWLEVKGLSAKDAASLRVSSIAWLLNQILGDFEKAMLIAYQLEKHGPDDIQDLVDSVHEVRRAESRNLLGELHVLASGQDRPN